MSNTVGRLQQKNCIAFYFCLLIVVACITAKMENDFVLQIFVKAAKEKGLQKYHNKWLLESSIVKIINAHYELYDAMTVDRFHKALRSANEKLLSKNKLTDIDNHTMNSSGIFRTTHRKKGTKRMDDIYYLHHDGNYDATTSSSQQNRQSSRRTRTTTTTDDDSNTNDGRRCRRKMNEKNNRPYGEVDSSDPDWYARLVSFDKSLEFESTTLTLT